MIVVDVGKQNESIKEVIVDIKLDIETSASIPDNTAVNCRIIHNNVFEYNPMINSSSTTK